MKSHIRYILPVLLLLVPPASVAQTEQPFAPVHYRIEVSIDPEQQTIEAHCVLRTKNKADPAGKLRFGLNRELSLSKVKILDGVEVPHQSVDPGKLSWISHLTMYELQLPSQVATDEEVSIEFAYSGKLPGTYAGCNMVGKDLVELDFYAFWYPVLSTELRNFDFDLLAKLPQEYLVLSDGRQIQSEQDQGYQKIEFRGNDLISVFLFAAPDMKTQQIEFQGRRVRVTYRQIDDQSVEKMLAHVRDAMDWFTEAYGPLAENTQETVEIVISPRRGQGYSRRTAIAISKAYYQSQKGGPEAIRGIVHEVAHLWWMNAPTNTSDDWLNESLAEFSSVLFTEKAFGPEKARKKKSNRPVEFPWWARFCSS